jgi:hypothetical protein
MSSAIKAIIQHQAALSRIDELQRQAATRRRFDLPVATTRRQPSSRPRALVARSRRPVLRGEGA